MTEQKRQGPREQSAQFDEHSRIENLKTSSFRIQHDRPAQLHESKH